jgi:organic radical activating enzyme
MNFHPTSFFKNFKDKDISKYSRCIGTAKSLILLFVKGCSTSIVKDYVILDKNPVYLDEVKFIIKNKTPLEDLVDKDSFDFIKADVKDFKNAWIDFLNSNFYFFNLDILVHHKKLCDELNNLPKIKSPKSQLVFLVIDHEQQLKNKYKQAVNNTLHYFYMKSFKEYESRIFLRKPDGELDSDLVGRLYARLNPTFCILPWIHLQYKQSKLCCRFDNTNESHIFEKEKNNQNSKIINLIRKKENLSIQKSNIENTFNSPYWEESRKLILDEVELPGCTKCYKEEQQGGDVLNSMRLGSNIMYNGGYLHKFLKDDSPSLEYLELGFGNYCNLACLTCNSTLSTTWHDDEVALNQLLDSKSTIKREIYPKLENLRYEPNKQTLESLKLIKFTGGEPMINPEFVRFIDLICDHGHPENIILEIYTNCSYIPSPKLLKNLVRFKGVQLNLSIDSYGKSNDYIRYGSSWEDGKHSVSSSLDFWLELGKNNKNIHVLISSTLSVLNIFEMPQLMSWWMKKYKDSGNKVVVKRTETIDTEYQGFFKVQPAFDPFYLNINILPKEYYREILEWITQYRNDFSNMYPEYEGIPESLNSSITKLENFINKSNGNKESAKLFLDYISKMDHIRKNSFKESLPKLHQAVNDFLK